MFADDTDLFYTNKIIKVLFDAVNKELHYVNERKHITHEKQNLFFHKKGHAIVFRDSIVIEVTQYGLQ